MRGGWVGRKRRDSKRHIGTNDPRSLRIKSHPSPVLLLLVVTTRDTLCIICSGPPGNLRDFVCRLERVSVSVQALRRHSFHTGVCFSTRPSSTKGFRPPMFQPGPNSLVYHQDQVGDGTGPPNTHRDTTRNTQMWRNRPLRRYHKIVNSSHSFSDPVSPDSSFIGRNSEQTFVQVTRTQGKKLNSST